MKQNIWMYANEIEQKKIADSLIVFGAEIFKRAKFVKEFSMLKEVFCKLNKKEISPNDKIVIEFVIEYIIDCSRVSIFFENYMKAKLIKQDFCIHLIDKDYPNFKNLAKEQKKRPIKLKEISEIENFIIDKNNNSIYHKAIKETTIGFKELTSSINYKSCYQIDDNIFSVIQEVYKYRNRLHFFGNCQFQLSNNFLSNIELLNNFVDNSVKSITRNNNEFS